MANVPAYPVPTAEQRAAMADYYGSMYPPVTAEYYSHVVSVCDEMDDPVNYPLLPRDRFDAMTDRIMSRLEDAQIDLDQFPVSPGFGFPGRRFHRRRDLARALIVSLLIAELLRRRRFCC